MSDTTIQDYDDVYLECRSLAHTWRHIGFFRDSGYVSRLAECTRCHMRRIQTMNLQGGYVSSPRYEAPEGYRMEFLERAEYRKETLRRAGPVFSTREQLLEQGQPTVAGRRAARKAAS